MRTAFALIRFRGKVLSFNTSYGFDMDRKLALEQVSALVNKYQENLKNGRIAKYNEEMTKKDFILPLFEALGWNTSDSAEVSAEEGVSGKLCCTRFFEGL